MSKRQYLLDLDYADVEAWLSEQDQPSFRARQIWEWIYAKRATRFEEMTNLPKGLRERLEAHFTLSRLNVLLDLRSKDRLTRKALFELPDGVRIETVKMAYRRPSGQIRNTLCISSQAGCALGCTFCATGQGGFQRNLSAGEIVEQVLFYARELDERDQQVNNVVYMGMGEPFANYDHVLASVRKLIDARGLNLGARKITISTVGLVPGIERFTEEGLQVNLAISLHAATDELRGKSMPVNRRFPIPVLLKACRRYAERTNRRITFEWAMIRGVNDTVEQATLLAEQLKGMLCHLNLIPLNPTQGFGGRASEGDRIGRFQNILNGYGIPNSVRARKGLDINAACGQLSQHYEEQLAAP